MKSFIKFLIFALALSSCGGKDAPPTPPAPEQTRELGAFNLVFPDNNLICTEGEDIGDNEVSINFLWSESENATSYILEVKNLDTQEVTNNSSTTLEKSITLAKDAQFSWTVTAVLGDKTKKSNPWNFYSEGIAEENFAPFPANVEVTDNLDSTIYITWDGSDLDNDITSYELYFGTENNFPLELIHSNAEGLPNEFTHSITYGVNYRLALKTIDSRNNRSTTVKLVNFQI